jgi:hypothetical protein
VAALVQATKERIEHYDADLGGRSKESVYEERLYPEQNSIAANQQKVLQNVSEV